MNNEKMVPVSEVIRYRNRAQKAEAMVDELQTQLAERPILGPIGGDLRDDFAGQALAGLLANSSRRLEFRTACDFEAIRKDVDSHDLFVNETAVFAYEYAAAMLAERKKVRP